MIPEIRAFEKALKGLMWAEKFRIDKTFEASKEFGYHAINPWGSFCLLSIHIRNSMWAQEFILLKKTSKDARAYFQARFRMKGHISPRLKRAMKKSGVIL